MIRVTGTALLAALENAVCAYPALEGRFPQVSNITFEFDPSLPPNHRVRWSKVGGEPMDPDRKYTLVTRGYMGRGKDGFDSLLVRSEGGEAEEIVAEENGILISMLLRQYFMSLKIIGKWKYWGKSLSRHWDGIHDNLHATHPVVEPNTGVDDDANTTTTTGGDTARKSMQRRRSVMTTGMAGLTGTTTPLDDSDDESDHRVTEHDEELTERELSIVRQVMRKWRRLAGLKGQAKCCDSLGEDEFQVDWTRVSLS